MENAKDFKPINKEVMQYLTSNLSKSAINTFTGILPYVEKYTNRIYLHRDDLALLIGKSTEDMTKDLIELNNNGFVRLYESPFVGIGLYINPFCALPYNSWKQDFS